MELIKIKLIGGKLPTKGSKDAAAYDLYAKETVILHYGENKVPLGFAMEMPHGIAAEIQPRSGNTLKGLPCVFEDIECRIAGQVQYGLIDCDYRGEVSVMINVTEEAAMYVNYYLDLTKAIAQMIFVQVPDIDLATVNELTPTERGDGGFGHSDKQS